LTGIAAVTGRIKLYASTAVLTLPPAIVARMALTIDSIAPGRFGINIVSGWAKAEYAQMGLWPGKEHYEKRCDYSIEYATVMKELWIDWHVEPQTQVLPDDRLQTEPEAIGGAHDRFGRPERRRHEFRGRICRFQFLSR
jgi:pyrimidine oxygenase